jgi:hypothetical protein
MYSAHTSARDYGIPFADILSKTNKHKEPWVADIAVLLAMTASMAGWFINPTHFYNLVQAFSYWFMPSLYVREGLRLMSDTR